MVNYIVCSPVLDTPNLPWSVQYRRTDNRIHNVGNIHQNPTQEDIPVEVVSHGYRNNRSSTTPEKLLKAVKTNDLQEIKTLIKKNKGLLSFEYSYPHFGRILYVACSEPEISLDTIKVLLELGAKPFEEKEGQEQIIHVVSRSTNSAILKVLVKHLDYEKINHPFRENNALLLLVIEADYVNKRDEFLECARILMESNININHADSNNLTAILWAIKKEYKDLIEVLLNKSAEQKMDLDNYTMKGKSARELINSKYPDLIPSNFKSEIEPIDLLFYYLKSGNEDAFFNHDKGDLTMYKDSDNYTYTLLQLSCKLGLLKVTSHLLKNKADVRKTTKNEKLSPLELATINGHLEIVELLLKYDENPREDSSTLCTLLTNMNVSDSNDNFNRCFKLLLQKHNEESLNSPSSNFQQTPIHYAIQFGKREHILDLLKSGSSLANKNNFGIMAIENIEADVLEQHLDDCVDINDIDKNNVNIDRDNVDFTLKYNTLLPSTSQAISPNLRPETDALLYISKAPYLMQLLTHPVLDIFLLLKWHKMKKIFYTNLIFYTFFITSLLTYIFSSYGNFHYISENDSFLLAVANTSYFILCLTYVILAMRECFQILVKPLEYFKDVENWIEVIMIFNVGLIFFISDPTKGTRKQLSSIAILLSTFELILLIGQHPSLTTYVVMFERVLTNFIKFLAWYFPLIAAFAMSFYILFSESVEEKHEGKKEDKEGKDENNNFFRNPGEALFKTLVMLTGEFDASDLKFDSYPVTSKVIFILFVLMIALILMNLLNGLAVSDTQSIENDAECVGLIARTEHIHYTESMLLGSILPSSSLHFLNNICQSLSKHISLNQETGRKIRITNDFELVEVDKKQRTPLKLDEKIQRKIRKVMQNKKTSINELQKKSEMIQMKNEQAKNLVEQNERRMSLEAYIRSKFEQIENELAKILTIVQDNNTKLPGNLM